MLGYELFEGLTNRSWHTYLIFVLITKKVASVTYLAPESFLYLISLKTPHPQASINLSAKIRKRGPNYQIDSLKDAVLKTPCVVIGRQIPNPRCCYTMTRSQSTAPVLYSLPVTTLTNQLGLRGAS